LTVHQRRREVVEKLRQEMLGGDGWLHHPYFRDLERNLARRPVSADLNQIHQAVQDADIVYLAEFHALRSCQDFAAQLLNRMAQGPGRVALGVEFVYTHQQHVLDLRQAGRLDDGRFLQRIHYREEWGYPWQGYAALLDQARLLKVPVYALDVPPRGGYEGLRARDEHAARRIAAMAAADPGAAILVLFGESHLARSHIPAAVRRRLRRTGRVRKAVTIFQDPDTPYWRLASSEAGPPPAASLGRDTWAVFHGTPLAKYEAYRQVLERWQEDTPPEEEVDLTPAVRHLITVLLDWLEIHPARYRLVHRAGWAETLEDAYPEVYSGPDARELLVPILEEHGRAADDVEDGVGQYRERGVLYDPRSNTLFLEQYFPGRAAGEGARFLRAALTGRLFQPAEGGSDAALRAYGAAYNEALAHLGTRLVDPASTSLTPGAGGRDTQSREWMAAHVRLEAGRLKQPTEEILAPLRLSRDLSRSLARDLGRRLGEQIYQNVQAGIMNGPRLRDLFRSCGCFEPPVDETVIKSA
jgi:hypothetical protein